jgi:dipeptidyl aminopeptidase/acylaminoacyl peptidase
MTKSKALIQPLDRASIALMLVLSLVIGLIILQGDVIAARVRNFSWQNQQIGADDISFNLVFSRPMDIKSVVDNLKIEPELDGKVSWAGRRMVYTLRTPAEYGTTYKVQLQGAKDKFSEKQGKNRVIQPFAGTFHTRDRVLLYIGTEKEEQGRLVLYNLTQKQDQKKLLTPKDLVVLDFKAFPDREKILFSARTSKNQDLLSSQIYSVTTGIASQPDKEADAPGRIDLILDNKDYQNLKFDLSPDGKTIVVQRGKKSNPTDFGLWFMPTASDSPEKPVLKRLQSQPGGDFSITPDSKAVAVAQGQGAAILPLQEDGSKPLDFLPQFGLVQAFAKDGSQAAMVKFNTDFTRDLFLVTNQGVEKSLLKTTGSIVSCQFDPGSPTLYCLVTQLIPGQEYQEQPYLVAIDLKTGQNKPLVVLPPAQRNIEMSLSPDGLGLVFDQIVAETNPTGASNPTTLKTDDGETIASSSLWLMSLQPINDPAKAAEIKPEKLPLIGFHPRWLP